MSTAAELTLYDGEVLPVSEGDDRLAELARKINEAHASCAAQWEQRNRHTQYALEQAVAAGQSLNDAKASLSHGQWQLWLAENCPSVQKSQAATYMKLARAAAAGEIDISSAGNLSIRSALKQLAAPKETRDAGEEEIEEQEPEPEPEPLTVDAELIDAALRVYRAHNVLFSREKVIARFGAHEIKRFGEAAPAVRQQLRAVFRAYLTLVEEK